MIHSALAYAASVAPVFPLNGSVPRTAHGVKDATIEPEIIRDYWKRWPAANIGLAAGYRFIVIDIDPRNGGSDSLLDIEDQYEPFPRTWTQHSGGGGLHFLYGAEPGTRVRAAIAPGVDCKGLHGYIVAAPSIHRSGRRYRWHDELHPLRSELTPAPQWLLDLTAPRPRTTHVATGPASECFMARAFDAAGRLGGDTGTGAVEVHCPWWNEHSNGVDAPHSSTVIFPPTINHPLGSFWCSHGHCHGRRNAEALRALPQSALDAAGEVDPYGYVIAMNLRGTT